MAAGKPAQATDHDVKERLTMSSERADNATRKYGVKSISLLVRRR
jgi:hypothetical protein